MARTFSGAQYLEAAKQLRDTTKSARELRQALAVLLPLECGASLEETAQILGRSRGAIGRLRSDFFAAQKEDAADSPKKSLQRRVQNSQQEAEIVGKLLEKTAKQGIFSVVQLKPLLEKQLGREICLATAYNVLNRYGWRKADASATKHGAS